MKITFYSNFLNHHQLPFCQAMIKQIGSDFTFVATEAIPGERVTMGYVDMNKAYPFVLRAYDGEGEYEKARQLSLESDVVIVGDAPNEFVEIRMKDNKLTFRYAERFFKKGIYQRLIPPTRLKIHENYIKYADLNYYVLCASAYTAYDLSLCGMKDNTIKWGYFPEVKVHDLETLFTNKAKYVVKILWVGRFIDWKRTEDAIEVARQLKENNYPFTMDIIGTGDCEEALKMRVLANDLTDQVSFLGAMSPEKVREHMENADIYLFTSNFKEGWGAVLNEAMNSGCAIIASHAIGSVPFLLKHKENGLIYQSENREDLYQNVVYLMENPSEMEMLGRAAYSTLVDPWNAEISAKRILHLAEQILSEKKIVLYEDGPCSRAEIIKNDWFDHFKDAQIYSR